MPILQKLIVAYKLWHGYWSHFDKLTRYSLGSSIDGLFLETIRDIFSASHKSRDQKIIYLQKASDEFDTLKFLLQVAWEIKALDNKKYIALSQHLTEIGRMLGGWQKQTKSP
ncbi:MAG: hypothetical protein A2735_01600 [Candidatus Yanofskybacteria bacterium RIFCSPHIGHO2_01_FULL_41_21]|uniref:bAvd-like domain-containing protein n=1 Tax=Candidatus Yanofskybacteria bacterium RIFCSPHIGHO2_01_FULL_41_21 TaxID=1802660 RepID=A0A1F8E9V7_9BACT|nr:MAG: hypothetical protein A2735_01600 [Candidatus Yanofskybacteria bacterium RIFCSPHIGHO2_01_FULL_41_21]